MMNAHSLTPEYLSCPNSLLIRPLSAEDSEMYRAIRQRILEIGDGRYFSDSYIREKQLVTEQQWHQWCTETREHCIMGVFINENLVGVMMITMHGLPENLEAEWEATWLDPKYRRCGIAKMAYEKVQRWTEKQGYERAVVFIRDDNTRSREIREKQGFAYVLTQHNEIWADGSIGDAHCFSKKLTSVSAGDFESYAHATRTLQETLEVFGVEDGHAT